MTFFAENTRELEGLCRRPRWTQHQLGNKCVLYYKKGGGGGGGRLPLLPSFSSFFFLFVDFPSLQAKVISLLLLLWLWLWQHASKGEETILPFSGRVYEWSLLLLWFFDRTEGEVAHLVFGHASISPAIICGPI